MPPSTTLSTVESTAGTGDEFDVDDCWALRTHRVHRSDGAGGLRCHHVGPAGDTICIPLGSSTAPSGLIVLHAGDEATLRHAHALADRLGRRRVVIAALAISPVAILVYAFADSLPLFFIARVVHGARRLRIVSQGSEQAQGSPLGREIRGCFEAAPGSVLVSADYSQVELRLMAHLSGDPVLTEAFRTGEDVHATTASRLFGVPADEVTPAQATPYSLAR